MTRFPHQNSSAPSHWHHQWKGFSTALIGLIAIASSSSIAHAHESHIKLRDPASQQEMHPSTSNQPATPNLEPDIEPTRFNLLEAADQLYQTGRKTEATLLYRKAKQTEQNQASSSTLPEPTFEVPNGTVKVYWREGNAGF